MRFSFLLLGLLCSQFIIAQRAILDSGGSLSPEQAAYDVSFYDLTLSIDPEEKSIEGCLKVEATVVHPTFWLVLDLDTLLQVEKVESNNLIVPYLSSIGYYQIITFNLFYLQECI
ncbi:MAG: hypothetical protein AAFO82_21680 [Bacteroidota bacterium]